jgi:hypothetical protein
VEVAKSKGITCRLGLRGCGPPPIQQKLRLTTQSQSEQGAGHWYYRSTVQDNSHLSRDVALAANVWGGGVDGTAQTIILKRQAVHADKVVNVDPREPLAAPA